VRQPKAATKTISSTRAVSLKTRRTAVTGGDAATDIDAPLSRAEAATFLNYSIHTLSNLAVLGRGPKFYSSGKKVFYLRCDLLEWVRSLPTGGSTAA